MATEEKKSALRTTGKVAWRVLLPFSAMRRTVVLAKKEAARTKESLGALKELGDNARKTIAEGIKGRRSNATTRSRTQ
ncbi:MAG: Branched-chain amino acid ABC-type transport system, permease components [uncultured Paraburkholderia sp.]|nr:MAG: Branched-chain amino acid ABC-type transport system, permease components [uncultured Paraburkholderia sp.]CAH2945341.1 MAG: Branched-chain amino acid ABC-type transport system, permease components [uncultured Paraburkholderia sp.]